MDIMTIIWFVLIFFWIVFIRGYKQSNARKRHSEQMHRHNNETHSKTVNHYKANDKKDEINFKTSKEIHTSTLKSNKGLDKSGLVSKDEYDINDL